MTVMEVAASGSDSVVSNMFLLEGTASSCIAVLSGVCKSKIRTSRIGYLSLPFNQFLASSQSKLSDFQKRGTNVTRVVLCRPPALGRESHFIVNTQKAHETKSDTLQLSEPDPSLICGKAESLQRLTSLAALLLLNQPVWIAIEVRFELFRTGPCQSRCKS
jgi:hypothetical protein